MDVSFISATMVLPAVSSRRSSRAALTRNPSPGSIEIVVLVKPQFEAGRKMVGKGGIVRDEPAQRAAVARVEGALAELGCARAAVDPSRPSSAAKAIANSCCTRSFRRLSSADSVQSEV